MRAWTVYHMIKSLFFKHLARPASPAASEKFSADSESALVRKNSRTSRLPRFKLLKLRTHFQKLRVMIVDLPRANSKLLVFFSRITKLESDSGSD